MGSEPADREVDRLGLRQILIGTRSTAVSVPYLTEIPQEGLSAERVRRGGAGAGAPRAPPDASPGGPSARRSAVPPPVGLATGVGGLLGRSRRASKGPWLPLAAL